MRQLDGTGLKRLHREWRRRTPGTVALILEDVEGPFNVGGIIRTAAALRAEDLWLAGRTPPPTDPKVAKTALGTERYLRLHRAPDGPTAVAEAHTAGYGVVALELVEGATPLHEADLPTSTCVVVGHEDRGCRPATLAQADAVAYLPLLGRVGSLNVASAASIALYELRRRSWVPSPGR